MIQDHLSILTLMCRPVATHAVINAEHKLDFPDGIRKLIIYM